MSTATYELARSIPARVGELRVLVDHAAKCESEDESLYNAICRAAAVLMASHLEGFLKELVRSIVLDLNFHIEEFSYMPAAMQRTFCMKIAFYEGVSSAEVEKRVAQLISFFSSNNVKVDMSAFPYKENSNRNPSPSFIDTTLGAIGVPSVLAALKGGRFEAVFDGDHRTDYLLRRDLRRFQAKLYQFPYKALPTPYTFNKSKDKTEGSLWWEFINGIMNRRHSVAHGDTLENETSWAELRTDALKIEVLMFAIIYRSCSFLGESLSR